MSNSVNTYELKEYFRKISEVLTDEQLAEMVKLGNSFDSLQESISVFSWERFDRMLSGKKE